MVLARMFRHASAIGLACRVRDGPSTPARAPRGISTMVLTRVKRRVSVMVLARRVRVYPHGRPRAPRGIPTIVLARARPCAPQNAQPRGLMYASLRHVSAMVLACRVRNGPRGPARAPRGISTIVLTRVKRRVAAIVRARQVRVVPSRRPRAPRGIPTIVLARARPCAPQNAQPRGLIYASSNPRTQPTLS